MSCCNGGGNKGEASFNAWRCISVSVASAVDAFVCLRFVRFHGNFRACFVVAKISYDENGRIELKNLTLSFYYSQFLSMWNSLFA